MITRARTATCRTRVIAFALMVAAAALSLQLAVEDKLHTLVWG